MAGNIRIEPFDIDAVADDDLRFMYEHGNISLHEQLPDEPVGPFEEFIAGIRTKSKFHETRRWVAWDGDTPVGAARAGMNRNQQENTHLGSARAFVLPEYRRRGIGTRLFAEAVEALAADGRTSLMSGSAKDHPGEAFLAGLGLEHRYTDRISRCVLAEIPDGLLEGWIEKAVERAPDYELVTWEGRTPDDMKEPWAKALYVMNSAPREGLDFEDEVVTVEMVEEWDDNMERQGVDHWTTVAVHRPSGEIAGLTDVYFSRWRDWECGQGNTGVFPDHRERGLGRWLKAAMALKVIAERPAVKWIDTDNAGSNKPMLAINDAMGFRPILWSAQYQGDLETARKALAEKLAG